MNFRHLRSFVFLGFLLATKAHASDSLDVPEHVPPKKQGYRDGLKNITFGGQYRTLVFFRDMKELYDGSFENQVTQFDITDGIRQAQLQLDISGKPTRATFFKGDLFLYSPMTGYDYEGVQQKVGLQLGVNLQGDVLTDHGLFSVRMGGIQYDKLSRMTLWQNEDFGESLYERRPWDPPSKVGENYASYYGDGTIARDVRWGNQNLQGLVVSGSRLPHNFDFKLMYVKTPNNGGFYDPENSNIIPNIASGFRVNKKFAGGNFAINNFRATSYSSARNGEYVGYNVLTGDFKTSLGPVKIVGEGGVATYESPTFGMGSSALMEAFVSLPKSWTKLPLDFHGYYIGPNATNINASFINTSVVEAKSGFNGQGGGGTFPFGGVLADLDQMTNNRKSLAVRTEFEPAKGLKFPVGMAWSQEVERLGNTLSYDHRVNGLTLFRIFPFVGGVGPNESANDITTYFRGNFEDLYLDEESSDFQNASRLNFNVIEINPKYNTRILGRNFYVFYLASFHSAGQQFSAVPQFFGGSPLLTVAYNELEMYYHLTRKVYLTSYLGYERVKAGSGTMANTETGLLKNQTGRAVGLGMDLELAPQASVYFRSRLFDYEDTSAPDNKYSGFETSVEIKILF